MDAKEIEQRLTDRGFRVWGCAVKSERILAGMLGTPEQWAALLSGAPNEQANNTIYPSTPVLLTVDRLAKIYNITQRAEELIKIFNITQPPEDGWLQLARELLAHVAALEQRLQERDAEVDRLRALIVDAVDAVQECVNDDGTCWVRNPVGRAGANDALNMLRRDLSDVLPALKEGNAECQ